MLTVACSGTFTPIESPSEGPFRALHSGAPAGHHCMVTATRQVACAGTNSHGELGSGASSGTEFWPLQIVDGLMPVDRVALASFRTCVLDNAGEVYCWGVNLNGSFGDGTINVQSRRSHVALNAPANDLAVNLFSGCVVVGPSGNVACWGLNDVGQLGISNLETRYTPAVLHGLSNVRQVVLGDAFGCALGHEGEVWCWGSDSALQLGTAAPPEGTCQPSTQTIRCSTRPVRVPLSSSVVAITAGASHACALVRDRSIWCWGNNLNGQLGTGSFSPSSGPSQVTSTLAWESVAAGARATCGISSGDVYCWGSGFGREPTNVPIQIQHDRSMFARQISFGATHVCALMSDGHVYCSGNVMTDHARASVYFDRFVRVW